MALTVDLGVRELAATRFAVSPLSETVAALLQLGGRDRQALNLRWLRWAEDELARDPLDLAHVWPLLMGNPLSWPEFLIPAPRDPGTSIEDDLAALRRTTARQVRTSLGRVFGDELPEVAAWIAAHPAAGVRAIAAELRAAHDRLISPHWPRIRAVLDADVSYRAKQLALGGAEKLFTGLHPDLHWREGKLLLEGPHWRTELAVNRGPGGLVLIPVALGTAKVLIKKNTSTQVIRHAASVRCGQREPAPRRAARSGCWAAHAPSCSRRCTPPRRPRTWHAHSVSLPAQCRNISAYCTKAGWSPANEPAAQSCT